ncbi:Serine/threonine-protein kinase pkn1 [Bremerella volcania]|uniref:Serine/threonine-protein kinase pkn1 n=1 Tax=Bremerella volcania TaxID=2527984 RepID=A0A518C8Q1_9BACT|nr:formylglycine-generating enzyme family protein [Bremerella volcania]QDU75582.1 Serine/threonine-protein kinase pkn1 [Bremerella volcania]
MSFILLLSVCWQAHASGEDKDAARNSLGMTMIRLSQGEFEMGMLDEHRLKLEHKASAYQREIHDYVEKPSFPVRLSHDFSIGETEVTVSQFRAFVEATGYQTDAEKAGEAWVFQPDAKDPLDRFSLVQGANWKNPGFEQSDHHPVTCVSWHDAQAFCQWLSQKEGVTYRLPTEAQWEYACRAGTRSSYFSGEEPDSVYAVGNVADATLYALHPEDVLRQRVVRLASKDGDGFAFTAPTKSFRPNAWGIYDTHGNVWEWCSDKYSDRYYDDMLAEARQKGSRTQPEPIVDPQGPEDTPKHQHGDWRSLRGGSWYVAPLQCRSSVRAFAEAHDAFSYIGFRVVRQDN